MLKTAKCLVATLLINVPAIALHAQNLVSSTGEKSAFAMNGGVTLTSDYRLRGISQSDRDFAVQGWISASHESGGYATIWGSSIDEYIAAGSDQEIDFVAGYKKTIGRTVIDLGVAYYFYPGSRDIVPGYDADFLEPFLYVTQPLGPVSAKFYAAYAPKQKALAYTAVPKEDNLYGALDLSGSMLDSKLMLTAHIGHSFSKSLLSSGKKYNDWSIGASYSWQALTFGATYVDTDFRRNELVNPISGKELGKASVLFSVGATF